MGRLKLTEDKIGKIEPGQTINGIVAVKLHRIETYARGSKIQRRPYWVFKCFCGNQFISRSEAVKGGRTLSCGCIRLQRLRDKLVKHGCCGSPEYQSWQSMKDRCNNPNNSEYKNYGGRGIYVSMEWQKSFIKFKKDVGPKPSEHHELDRIDNNKGYEYGNCRWITKNLNMQNARTSRVWFIHGHRFNTMADAAKFYEVSPETIRYWCGLRKNSGLPLCYSVKRYLEFA